MKQEVIDDLNAGWGWGDAPTKEEVEIALLKKKLKELKELCIVYFKEKDCGLENSVKNRIIELTAE